MVPPLRLKKVAYKQQQLEQQQQQQQESAGVAAATPTAAAAKIASSTSLMFCDTETVVVASSQSIVDGTNYRIVNSDDRDEINGGATTMGNDQLVSNGSCTPKSIEITIPSVPELGIKETRTDRIDLTQDTTTYIVGNDKNYPTLAPVTISIPLTRISPTPIRTPDAGVNQQKPADCGSPGQPTNLIQIRESSQSPFDENSRLSMPLLIVEEHNDDVSNVGNEDETNNNNNNNNNKNNNNNNNDDDEVSLTKTKLSSEKKPTPWFAYRQKIRVTFREERAKALQSRKQLVSRKLLELACALPEERRLRGDLQKEIDSYERKIHHYTNLLRQLNDANDRAKFERFVRETNQYLRENLRQSMAGEEARKIAAADESIKSAEERSHGCENGSDEERKEYAGDVATCNEVKQEHMQLTKQEYQPQPSPPRAHSQETDFASFPREIEASNEQRAKSAAAAVELSRISPTSSCIVSPSAAAKSVIVEPIGRSSAQQPQLKQQQRNTYMNFTIDELSNSNSGCSGKTTPQPAPQQKRALPPNGSPVTAPILRPSTGYPAQASASSRAPPHSPREALIPGAWTDHQHCTASTDVPTVVVDDQQRRMSGGNVCVGDRRVGGPLDLAVKASKRQDEEPGPKEVKRKRRRVSDVSTQWTPSYQQQAVAYPATIPPPISSTSSSASTAALKKPERYGHQQPMQVYYVPEPCPWTSMDMMPIQRHARSAHEMAKSNIEYRTQQQQAQNVHALNKQNAAAAEEQRQPKILQKPNPRLSSKAQLSKAAAAGDHQTPVESIEVGKSAHEQRLMSEFPTLGNWVAATAGFAKKPTADSANSVKQEAERMPSAADARQAYYQHQAGMHYKAASDHPAPVATTTPPTMANNGVRWSAAAEQHQQPSHTPFPQMLHPATIQQFQQQHHPGFYPPMPQYPMEFYQKHQVLGYNAPPFPYSGLQYSPIPLEIAAATAGQVHPAMIPPMPMASPSLAEALTSDKRRYYATAEPLGAPRMPYANYGRRGSLGVDYPMQQLPAEQHYIRMLPSPEQRAYEQQQQQQRNAQQRVVKVSSPDINRTAVTTAKQYKSAVYAVPSARNGHVVHASPSTPTAIYSSSISSTHQQHHGPLPSVTLSQTAKHQQPPAFATYESNADIARRASSPAGIVSHPRCSNCGTPGSCFKCLGCETAFYCNETCQAQHWTVHVTQCPKIMPKLKKVA